MFDIRRILCPTDLSETSQTVLAHAVAVGRWYESEIAALHVEDPLAGQPAVPSIAAMRELHDGNRYQLRLERLRGWLEPARSPGCERTQSSTRAARHPASSTTPARCPPT